MVSEDLLNYIRVQQAQGFTPTQIRSFLKNNGYDQSLIEEHFKILFPRKQPIKPLILVVGLIVLLVLVGGVVFASWYFSRPVCGNGELEEGENSITCCIDAGCSGDETCEYNECKSPSCDECQFLNPENVCVDYQCCQQTDCESTQKCENYVCRDITCGYCQYVSDHACAQYDCCIDADCGLLSYCVDHTCQALNCDNCQYVSNGVCTDYICCEDIDCDDLNNETADLCTAGGTINALCENEVAPECFNHKDCDDDLDSTEDQCGGSPRICINREIVKCLDDDNYCPQGCTFNTDDDCDECVDDDDCDDDTVATTDTCEGSPTECVNTFTTDCITDDYCPDACDWKNDPDCEMEHECDSALDCDDFNISTTNICSGIERVCSYTEITDCVGGDGYCPLTCTWETDNNCVQPSEDFSIEGDLEVHSLNSDYDLGFPNCADKQILVFNVLHDFQTPLENIEFEILENNLIVTDIYSPTNILRSLDQLDGSLFYPELGFAYIEYNGSLFGKKVKIGFDTKQPEHDLTNNFIEIDFSHRDIDYSLGEQTQYTEVSEYYLEEGDIISFNGYSLAFQKLYSNLSIELNVDGETYIFNRSESIFLPEKHLIISLNSVFYIEHAYDNSASLRFAQDVGFYGVEIFKDEEIDLCVPFAISVTDNGVDLPFTFEGFGETRGFDNVNDGEKGLILVSHDSSSMTVEIDSTNIVDETNELNNVKSY